ALKDEMKKEYQALDMCVVLDSIIRTPTIKEDNEVLKVVNNATLGCNERLALVEEKYKVLTEA
ncbi:hypothetical protein KI387_017327, partial [Taxus chinensis]